MIRLGGGRVDFELVLLPPLEEEVFPGPIRLIGAGVKDGGGLFVPPLTVPGTV